MVVLNQGESYDEMVEKVDMLDKEKGFNCLSDTNCDCVTVDYNCPGDT